MSEVIKSYKGFNKDMTCRDFQYKEGESYHTDTAKCCEEGFHACEYPLDVFNYYSPAESVFHEVEQSGEISRDSGDSKVASTNIKIGAKIDIKGLIKASFEYIKEKCTNTELGGNRSALTGGNRSALTGGYSSALTGGNRSALTGGYSSALTGGDSSALTGGDSSALTGGNSSALTGGDWSVIYGGEGARVRGGLNSILALQEWEECNLKSIKVAIVDGKKIKPNTWYTLINGELKEVK